MCLGSLVTVEQVTEGRTVGAKPTPPPRLWWGRRALALHLTLAVVLPLFTWAFVWQVNRVRQGNELSWAYVFEWPFFAAYAIYLWWKLLHDQTPGAELPARAEPGAVLEPAAPETRVSSELPEEDEELAAYNRYLAELNTSGRRKRW